MSFRASTPFVVVPAMTELWAVATTIIYTAAWGMTEFGVIMATMKRQNALLVMMRFGETKVKIHFMAVMERIPYMEAHMMTRYGAGPVWTSSMVMLAMTSCMVMTMAALQKWMALITWKAAMVTTSCLVAAEAVMNMI